MYDQYKCNSLKKFYWALNIKIKQNVSKHNFETKDTELYLNLNSHQTTMRLFL